MKAIITDKGIIVPYAMVVSIRDNGDGYLFHDILGTLHKCNNTEGKDFLNSLN